MSVRFGLVGYGVGGRLFHSPYLRASRETEFVGIVTASPERAALAALENPGVEIFATVDDLVAEGVDAVVVSTPPHTRRDIVLDLIGRGVHVVADKPFGPTADAARDLVTAAAAADVILNVFHNRRWDADIVTAAQVRDSGVLGAISRLDLRCDQDSPGLLEAGPTGGLLRDLGSHVIDQALLLLGPAETVSAQLDLVETPTGTTDAAFAVAIRHVGGAHSHVSSTKLARLSSRELRLIGEKGSYRSDFSDVQYEAIAAGWTPDGNAEWGIELSERWGVLGLLDGHTERVPSARGSYVDYYDAFARAVRDGGPGPVPAAEGVRVLEVLDAARLSSEEGRTVKIG